MNKRFFVYFFGMILAAGAALSLGTLAMAKVAPTAPVTGLKRFASCSALKTQIAKASSGYAYGGVAVKGMPLRSAMPAAPTAAQDVATAEVGSSASAGSDYSQTNVQVKGVDEADIVKLDGTYVYHLTKNRLAISRVSGGETKLLSMTNLETDFQVQDLYVEKDRVMLIGSKWESRVYPMPLSRGARSMIMPWRGQNLTTAQVWDVSNREKPKKLRSVDFDGSLSSTRLIQGRVYFVMNSYTPWGENTAATANNLVPNFRDSKTGKTFQPLVRCADVAYFDIQPTQSYIAVTSLPMSGTGDITKRVVLGSSETLYATESNLYVARQDWQATPIKDSLEGTDGSGEKTVIYKFGLKDGVITYQTKGSVAGHLLNQFSLDEENGNLRVATTKGNAWDSQRPSQSNIYVLSSEMKPRGKIEGIAPGEQIYAMRFMGNRGYMVTFKKIDPFFVIDLANPDAPKVLGKLKIPGYSDYLHPMDENHVIGLGKNAEEAEEGDFAWYQGIKMAVFDVTDVAHPKEMWKTEIGDRGTDSPALHDHKAFFYAPTKNLLAIPVTVAEISPEQKAANSRGSQYGEFTFQGAYVYRLTLDRGFELMSKITHLENDDSLLKSGYYYGGGDDSIERVQYSGDNLITLSNNHLRLHRLSDFTLSGNVDYPKPPTPKYDEPPYGVMPVPMMVK